MTLWPNPLNVHPWLRAGEIIDEPPRGVFVHARYPDHHTAGYVFHRDDREGHSDGRVWWSYQHQAWWSWSRVTHFAARFRPPLVLQPLFRIEQHPACQPDGAHGPDHC
jgi:hypothetical protein